MRSKPSVAASGPALDTIEAEILPTLAALLGSVTEQGNRQEPGKHEARSAELRDKSRQIIELTRFLAAVSADAQAGSPRISA